MGILLGGLLIATGIVGMICGFKVVIIGIAAVLTTIGVKKAKGG